LTVLVGRDAELVSEGIGVSEGPVCGERLRAWRLKLGGRTRGVGGGVDSVWAVEPVRAAED